MADPISDMFSSIRNAIAVKKDFVEIPPSVMKRNVAKLLKEEGFISRYDLIDKGKNRKLRLELKYYFDGRDKISVLRGIRRISKPGRRVYSSVKDLPTSFAGTGVFLLSTPKGILTSKEAKRLKQGGEILGLVW